MFDSLLRLSRARRRAEKARQSSTDRDRRRARVESTSSSNNGFYRSASEGPARRVGDVEASLLLPIFSAPHLDRIPVYNLQHRIRMLVMQRAETTLSWDQLRSPQVSQFLVKPIHRQIQDSNPPRGTLYALLANCLQFQKDGEMNPGNIGVCRTRAMICELLAMRMLKELDTQERIDALFYDFDPLQGMTGYKSGTTTPVFGKQRARMRISAVEIAIRAQAKRFLAHPLVVAQLEAIWAGTIVFNSVADTLHRRPVAKRRHRNMPYGTFDDSHPSSRTRGPPAEISSRRSVTLYDPSEASFFKLSRLRVPRYRQIFSTLSFGVMLGLFLAVLAERSLDITGLELIFWFWSAGYMMDEIVGFSEQGFSLYIMSVWNAFDIGILLLFVAYYVLRLYSILIPDGRRVRLTAMAYDVLASTAVLLVPRLFSALDHYQYFSQLLIAFRMMAVDLAAILLLIGISCSGFFVAFTMSFSFSDSITASNVAYALFQILMGFTPAAWEMWPNYNFLGKAILTLFLIICHFLIVTILITVLTNSFTAVAVNANDEHQFLFAVNTISMVKSEALFSYIPPTNILGWILSPLRFIIPFRRFVWVNRTLIKLTHIPILFSICAYERLILSSHVYEPDVAETRGRNPNRVPAFTLRGSRDLFSPGMQLREPSVTAYKKDRALEAVFQRPPLNTSPPPRPSPGPPTPIKSQNLNQSYQQSSIDAWIAGIPPRTKRPALKRSEMAPPKEHQRAFVSDPEHPQVTPVGPSAGGPPSHDGDDELATANSSVDANSAASSFVGGPPQTPRAHQRTTSTGTVRPATGGLRNAMSAGVTPRPRRHAEPISIPDLLRARHQPASRMSGPRSARTRVLGSSARINRPTAASRAPASRNLERAFLNPRPQPVSYHTAPIPPPRSVGSRDGLFARTYNIGSDIGDNRAAPTGGVPASFGDNTLPARSNTFSAATRHFAQETLRLRQDEEEFERNNLLAHSGNEDMDLDIPEDVRTADDAEAMRLQVGDVMDTLEGMQAQMAGLQRQMAAISRKMATVTQPKVRKLKLPGLDSAKARSGPMSLEDCQSIFDQERSKHNKDNDDMGGGGGGDNAINDMAH
ncbi:hypothetical protein EJ06DRAFT_585076 [Trichodelitschia bisporula]|uniref:Ion transport domain-containing protein n=1 Tax=Trichodelitschia bisporula TaxID=703511 RepID=A0A6G1HKU5_9PEZI|nr:hypothetical protein EJ06DRAFT_585076 [Trichodelitschia bisporula]